MKDRIYFCFYDGTYDYHVYQESEDNGLMLLYKDDYMRPDDPFKKFYKEVAYGLDNVIVDDNTMDNILTIYMDDQKLNDSAIFFLKLCKYLNWALFIVQDAYMSLVKIKDTKEETKDEAK